MGAGYANRNQYNQYHPGMAGRLLDTETTAMPGNRRCMAMAAGVGGLGHGLADVRLGFFGYNNAYYGLPQLSAGQLAAPTQARGRSYDYSQPISTTAAAPAAGVTDQATTVFDQARDAFKQGNYAQAIQLGQQALGQTPNDPTLHEFLALALFAQGQYDQAASPLYAVLSVGPGWNWTTLIGMYPDANSTPAAPALEAYVKANPQSAPGHFVLGYHYVCQGHNEAAAKQFEEAARLQPSDTLSAQLAAHLQPSAAKAADQCQTRRPPRRTGQAGKACGKLGSHSGQGFPGRAHDPGRRQLHLGRHRPGQAGDDHRRQVHVRRRHAYPRRPEEPERGTGRPGGLARREPLDLPGRRGRSGRSRPELRSLNDNARHGFAVAKVPPSTGSRRTGYSRARQLTASSR